MTEPHLYICMHTTLSMYGSPCFLYVAHLPFTHHTIKYGIAKFSFCWYLSLTVEHGNSFCFDLVFEIQCFNTNGFVGVTLRASERVILYVCTLFYFILIILISYGNIWHRYCVCFCVTSASALSIKVHMLLECDKLLLLIFIIQTLYTFKPWKYAVHTFM